MKPTTQIIITPFILGLLSIVSVLTVNYMFSENSFLIGVLVVGFSFYIIGFLNYKKTWTFKQKTIRLIVFAFTFLISGFISYFLIYSADWLYVLYFIKLTLIILSIGFLMNIFLIMKKGHWIAIITLGFLSLLFMVQGFLDKQQASNQTTVALEQIKLVEQLKEEVRLQKETYELKLLLLEQKIDSLENLLEK